MDVPIVAGDDDGASSGLLAVEDLVGGLNTLFVVGGSELLGEVVVSDGTDVGGRVGGEDVLLEESSMSDRDAREQEEKMGLTAAPRQAFWAAPPALFV